MSTSGNPTGQTPAGWFTDPSGSGRLRYWDGSAWTEHYAPGAATPPTAAYPTPTATYPTPQAPQYQAPPSQAAPYPAGYGGPPPRQGMSGCLKAFLIVFALLAAGGIALTVALVAIGGRVVKHLSVTIAGTPGRPASMPAGAHDYAGERKQDHVTTSGGTVTLGSISASTANWVKTNVQGIDYLCGSVAVHRGAVKTSNPFDAALELTGDFSWELVPPTGPSVSYLETGTGAAGINNFLSTGQSGDFSGKVCFPYPTGTGQFAVTWQPRLLQAQRAVWLLSLN